MESPARGILLVVIGIVLLISGPAAFGGTAGTVIAVIAAVITCVGAYVTYRDRKST